MKLSDQNNVSQLLNNVQSLYNNVTTQTNTNTTEMFNTLNDIATTTQKISNSVAIMSDMITDLVVVNSTANSLISLVNLPVHKNTNVSIDRSTGRIGLAQNNSKNVLIDASKSFISSLNPYTISDLNSTPATFSDLIATNDEIIIDFNTSVGYAATINLVFNSYVTINTLNLNLGLVTKSYPLISSITYNDVNNNTSNAVILNTNIAAYNLNSLRVVNNEYTINTSTITTNRLSINISDLLNNSITFKSIFTTYNTYAKTGNIVLGPIYSPTAILKTAINSKNSTGNTIIKVSSDEVNWNTLANSSSIVLDNTSKIISYNTINETSFKTNQDVKSLYISLTFNSEPLPSSVSSIYNTYKGTTTIPQSILKSIDPTLFSAYSQNKYDPIYGVKNYYTNCSSASIDFSKVDGVTVNGAGICIGSITSTKSVSKNTAINSVGFNVKPLRLSCTSTIPATGFDLSNASVFDIALKYLDREINVAIQDNLIIALQVPEDIYNIRTTTSSLQIDLTCPYVTNSLTTTIVLPYEPVTITNSIGTVIYQGTIDQLENIGTTENPIYTLNLIDILYKAPEVIGYTLSKNYPLIALGINEYALVSGKIIIPSGTVVHYKGLQLEKTPVTIKKYVNYQNGNYIKREDTNFTYFGQIYTSFTDSSKVIKLGNVAIQKGSVKLFEYDENNTNNFQLNTSSGQHQFFNIGTDINPVYINIIDNQYLEN